MDTTPQSPSQASSPGKRILADLRNRIVDGTHAPGSRLPTRAELQERYGSTPVTMQRVFNQLASEGFIVARGRLGTFVSETPPHLCAFAVVFPYRDRPERPWPQLWRALATEARKLQRPGVTLTFSYGNETHEDLEPYQRLVGDVTSHRLGGVIFASKPRYLIGSPVLESPGVPRVAVMAQADIPGVKAVAMKGDWLSRAIDILLAAGRRRVAALTVPTLAAATERALKDRKLDGRPYWIQAIHPDACQAARNAARLLMAADPQERPDGLIIADDNLVEAASNGLVDAGIKVPEELAVVAHCNFPYPTPCAVPATRLGYDVQTVLAACMDNLIRQRLGGSVPEVTEVGAVSTDELAVMKRTW